MPIIDLATPTTLLFQWAWLLVTSANAVVYLGILVVFILGMTVRLPRTKRDFAAARSVEASGDADG
jgi:hypothetical protein